MMDFETARRTMVDNQLRTVGITDRRILTVMEEVPREVFVPAGRQALAYVDTVHPLGGGRVLGAAAPFARLLQLAGVSPTDRALDVGAGTGYSTAVLARLCAEVTGLESDADLATAARQHLQALGASNATVVDGPVDGSTLKDGKFDVIILEGAVDAVPHALLACLADGGRLAALLNGPGLAVANLYVKAGQEVTSRQEFNTSLPQLMPQKKEQAFVF